jgi:predicted enzyme related to lactoylglutathione lyase
LKKQAINSINKTLKLKTMDGSVNTLNWFEISVGDIARAKKFYETIFSVDMGETMEMMGMQMAMFPGEPMNGKVSGGLVQGPMHTPSMDGAKIYFNGNPDLDEALGKVEAAGGKVTMPKTKISDEIGHMAFFIDSEGNGVALHSNN